MRQVHGCNTLSGKILIVCGSSSRLSVVTCIGVAGQVTTIIFSSVMSASLLLSFQLLLHVLVEVAEAFPVGLYVAFLFLRYFLLAGTSSNTTIFLLRGSFYGCSEVLTGMGCITCSVYFFLFCMNSWNSRLSSSVHCMVARFTSLKMGDLQFLCFPVHLLVNNPHSSHL